MGQLVQAQKELLEANAKPKEMVEVAELQAVTKQLAESQSNLTSTEEALSEQAKQMELNKIAAETKQATMATENETSAAELAKCQAVLATAEKDIENKSNA